MVNWNKGLFAALLEIFFKTAQNDAESLFPVLYKKRYTDPHGEERKRNKTTVKLTQVPVLNR